VRHAQWKALDLLWGNGESLGQIVACGLFVIVACAVVLTWKYEQFTWPTSFWVVTRAFWGVQGNPPMPSAYLTALTVSRFVLFGLFMAILIKRLARR
jgi:hypothetical protein